MIVKLGNGYFDRDAIAAIVPMNPPRFKVVLTSGAMVGLEVDGDVGEELEKAGVLELIQEPVREYDFTESEVVQLGESLRASVGSQGPEPDDVRLRHQAPKRERELGRWREFDPAPLEGTLPQPGLR